MLELELKERIIAQYQILLFLQDQLQGQLHLHQQMIDVYEGNETGIVAISTVSGGSATESGTQSVTITITENESAPTVTLSSSANSIAENAGSSLTLTATLSLQPQLM